MNKYVLLDNNDEEFCNKFEVTEKNCLNYSDIFKLLRELELEADAFHFMYNENKHLSTSDILYLLKLEINSLQWLVEFIIKYDIRIIGAWIVLYRIINKVILKTKKNINKLPMISKDDSHLKYLNRKIKISSIKNKIILNLENLKIINNVLPYLLTLSKKDANSEFEKMVNLINKEYFYPFWYDHSKDVRKFKSYMQLFKNTVIGSNDYPVFTKPFSMIFSACENLVNQTLFERDNTKKGDNLLKKYATVEIIKDMWNMGETQLANTIIQFSNPEIKFVEKIKVIDNKYESEDILNFIEIEMLFLSNHQKCPIEIPQNKIFINSGETFEENTPNYDIILHIHGGGFISGNPNLHEMYLRKWAIDTNCIVLSINYSKAPKSKFPIQIDECYYIYECLIKTNTLKIKPKKIILAGDSAGGNIALAVTIKAIENNLPVPDGLLLAYPALNCNKIINISRFLFSYDVLLNYHVLLTCLKSYLNENDDPKDPYISPFYMNDDILKKFPENIWIFSAGFCPLLDDTIDFVDRLKFYNKGVRHWIFDLPHGFLNFGYIINDSKKIIELGSNLINNILN